MLFQQHNIHVLVLSVYSSTILQPLDLTCHIELKRLLRQNFKIVDGEKRSTTCNRLLFTAVECFQVALSGLYIKKGFSRAGIYPFSVNALLDSTLVIDPNDQIDFQPPLQKSKAIKFAGKLLTGTCNAMYPSLQLTSIPTLSLTPIFPIIAPLNPQYQITPPPIPYSAITHFMNM